MKQLTALVVGIAILMTGCSEPLSTQESAVDLNSAVLSKTGASGKVKAPATDLEVEILESNSDFVNYIYLVSSGSDLLIASDDAWGTVVALPTVSRNQELIFEIRVFEPGGTVDTGMRWQTGPPARNADLQKHAQVEYQPDGSILVSFEDIDASGWGVGDEPNFVDAVFAVRPQP